MNTLLSLISDFQDGQLSLSDFQEEFLSYYFDNKLFDTLPVQQLKQIENVVLALNLTRDDESEPVENGVATITVDRLLEIITIALKELEGSE